MCVREREKGGRGEQSNRVSAREEERGSMRERKTDKEEEIRERERGGGEAW